MRITADDVRRLMESDDPDAALVLVEGRVQVAAEPTSSALVVTSRRELLDRLGSDRLAAQDYETVAAGLDNEVSNLGG